MSKGRARLIGGSFDGQWRDYDTKYQTLTIAKPSFPAQINFDIERVSDSSAVVEETYFLETFRVEGADLILFYRHTSLSIYQVVQKLLNQYRAQ
jgi:hypothetical protein